MATFIRKQDESDASFLSRMGLSGSISQSHNNALLLLQGPDIFSRDHIVTDLVKASPASIVNEGKETCAVEFHSYSGADTKIYLMIDMNDTTAAPESDLKDKNFCPLIELQTISISSARSVHPVRRLGESHVEEFSRGPRTIAGTMVCVTGLSDVFARVGLKSRREKSSKEPFFTDELPSFHVLITCSNEYGHVSHAALSDVTLTNFGTTFSEADMYNESTYTWVARFYHPLLSDPTVLNHLDFTQAKQDSKLSNIWRVSGTHHEDFVAKPVDWEALNKLLPSWNQLDFAPTEVEGIQNWINKKKP